MKHQAFLTIQAKLKLAITGETTVGWCSIASLSFIVVLITGKLIIAFSLFGRDTLWRIPRKRVARGGRF